ncbi:hypothetical protein I4U23_023128 [Adineta vaga]|nr:hypothetical protein I4U23_023128 [Adineta vaga]
MNTKTTQNRAKRDLEFLRNIVFLISIYIAGGLPSIVYFLTPTKYPYLINLVTQSIAVALATLCTILLDRDIRQVIKNILRRTTRVVPFVHTLTMGKVQQNRQTIKQINIH